VAVVTAGGRQIHYDDSGSGSGPVALFVAGLGSPRGSWADAVAGLGDTLRCLALDNRDAGENDPETAPYSIADMADDCAAFLSALDVANATVFGSSMGGFIALQLALRHPRVVERLVLVGTSPVAGLQPMPPPDPADWIADPLERARQRLRVTTAPGYFERFPERLEELALQTTRNRMTVEGYARQTRAINDTHDVRQQLGEISAPTLVVHGDLDPLIPLRAGEMLAQGIPNAQLEVRRGVGHLPHREEPLAFCWLARAFVA
jgi:pimeloyl-ACP methyl ester carboxylesterase